ncbi:MAG: dGTP triphosphohydrolase [Sedimentibacter saalensis]|uniref:deoxyguanosinetriphosphate triphosphohydrolase family protein n=1 Tax=Sedimentibacter saalensis TaxID=130788 RepID=UPI0031595CB2
MQEENLLRKQSKVIQDKFIKQLKNSSLESRCNEENNRPRIDGPFQRDFTRIMYSSSFRRLQGKMQLLGIKEDQFFRNRLTHSLEVAQIARSMATELDYNNKSIFVVEAGALAHDLGNPPFGHSGERILNKLFYEVGGFEGNAQTLRILTRLETKSPSFQGMNLTYRTLLSVIKYFRKLDKTINIENKQKFIYDDDYELINRFLLDNKVNIRTLDVQIVDIADEIAYAAHDLEDGLWKKCFNIDEILYDFYKKYGECKSYNTLNDIVNKCREKAKCGSIDSSEYSKIFRKEISSMIIYNLINDVGLKEVSIDEADVTGTDWDKELRFTELGDLAEGLKKIVFECINHNDEVYSYEKFGDIVIVTLVDIYRNDPKLLPPEYRAKNLIDKYKLDYDEKNLQERLICDYISGMMDSYAISTYEKFNSFTSYRSMESIKNIDKYIENVKAKESEKNNDR